MAIVSVRRSILCGLFLSLACFQIAGIAHRLPPEVLAFFRVDDQRLRIVVRVPTAILGDAALPRVETTFLDLRNTDRPLAAVAAEVARSLDITEGGRALTPGPARWRLSILGDTSFSSYDSAVAHIAGPPVAPDRLVYWSEAYVDVQLDYAVTGAAPRIEARLNGLRLGGDFFQTRATFSPASGSARTITVVGAPRRVLFEPPAGQAVSTVLRQGLDFLPGERFLWLFLLCLAIPDRRAGQALRPLGAWAIVLMVTFVIATQRSLTLGEAAADLIGFVTGGLVALAAVQVLVGSGMGWTIAVAALFGVPSGAVLASRMHQVLPLAGAHGILAAVAFALLLVTLLAGLLLLLVPLVRVPYGWRAPAWLITAVWCLLPAHEAAHAMMGTAERLATYDSWLLSPLVAMLVAHWPILALAGFWAAMWAVAWNRRDAPLVDAGAGL